MNLKKLIVGDRKDQYPGVYFSIKSRFLRDHLYNDLVYFVFSPALLKSYNSKEYYGRVSDTSYDSTTFYKLLNYNTNGNELVMHHDCPLDYLELIIINDENFEYVKKITNGLFTVISKTEFKKFNTKLINDYKKIYSPLTFKYPPLSLNYYAYSDDESIASITTIKYALLNFGASYEDTIEYIRKYKNEDLVDILIQLNESRIVNFSVKYHPPFCN